MEVEINKKKPSKVIVISLIILGCMILIFLYDRYEIYGKPYVNYQVALHKLAKGDVGTEVTLGGVKWLIVLPSHGSGEVLLVAKNSLWEESYGNYSWEKSRIRESLTNFYENHFNSYEKNLVCVTENIDPYGNRTEDRLYLPCLNEIAAYFFMGDFSTPGETWWVRDLDYCTFVDWGTEYPGAYYYYIDENGARKKTERNSYHGHGVRPIMWLSLPQK